LTGTSGVKIGGISAKATIISETKLTATVPDGALTGSIRITSVAGVVTSATNFVVTLSVTGFTPLSGPVGTSVTVNGVGFNSSSVVKFNGIAAATTLISPTQLTATVPAGATTGLTTVTNTAAPTGTVKSRTTFTVL
jgi:hypothetical protein